MKYIKGDLIEQAKAGEFDVIVHGCNCFNSMGAGIAATIHKQMPAAWEADQKTIKGDKAKIVTYTHADIKFGAHTVTVINAYTQYKFFGKEEDLFEYEGFERILKELKRNYSDKKIGLPLIGCGLAGGDKDRILKMIEVELEGVNATVVEWTQNHVPLYKNIK
jgi:O-acetyl-ADP-ribose deacetylase (regulator of RNase III)